MKKIAIIAGVLLVVLGGGFILIRSQAGAKKGQAVLKVASIPATTIFLNNDNIGTTPFENKVDAGEYTIKLVPESTDQSLVSWEEKIKLEPNLLTYVNRDLGESDLKSAGEVLTLEKTSGKEAQLAVLSVPDGATITIAGQEKGTTPQVIQDLPAGSYELQVIASGFVPRSVKIKTTAGYKLNASFQLAVSGETGAVSSPQPSTLPSPASSVKPSVSPATKASPQTSAKPGGSPKAAATPPAKPYVEILETPTGFLRVRQEPSTSAEEVTRVSPGEYYPLLDETGGWYKIEYEDGKEGWISGQYAKKYE